jgi:hypothetical protein
MSRELAKKLWLLASRCAPIRISTKVSGYALRNGPLAGTEGILLQYKPTKGLLVLSIELLQRSVAVEIACSMIVAA